MIEKIESHESGIDVLSMKNDQLEVVVSNYGCTIMKVIMSDGEGIKGDVVLGYDSILDYGKVDAYLGALVGRVANRIGKGVFELNGKEYHLAINNGPNHLHGGIKGFSYCVFDYQVIDDYTIEFSYLSKDMEEGYPGNLKLKAIYTLDGDELRIRYLATCDQDTLINITNHSYFNLSSKKEDVLNHKLCIHADSFACVDSDGLTTGEFRNVEGTPFDFRKGEKIGKLIGEKYDQLEKGNGYDHPFIFNEKKNQVILTHEESKRRLIVSTTLPMAQIYTANYLDGRVGKYGDHYYARDAVCIETQHLPDAIHLQDNPLTILKKGNTYDETTSYKFEVMD